MKDIINKIKNLTKKMPLVLIGCLFLIVTCLVSLVVVSTNTAMSVDASQLTAKFIGEYKIGDGDWQDITDGGHISATQGEVTLRGKFNIYLPNGEFYSDNPKGFPINFYCNHVSVKIRVDNNQPIAFETEHPQLGVDACGAKWSAYRFPTSGEGYTEIVISNPHKLGNDLAVDQFLDSVRLDEPMMLGNALSKEYDGYRHVGFSFFAIALVVFVLSVVAVVAKLNIAKLLWIIGFWILFTGGFYILDLPDVFFWNDNMPFNTTALCLCQILSNFFLTLFGMSFLSNKNKKFASILQVVVGVVNLTLILLATFGVMRIFDVRFYHYIIFAIHAIILCVLCALDIKHTKNKIIFVLIGSIVSMVCLCVDFFGVSFAILESSTFSKIIYGVMLVIVIAFGINAIISNYKVSLRTKEMETELKDKSISVMISQIQPHFLYNSLNSIAELCVVDPKRAEKATINFSRYLRGNMGALNEKKTIEFEDELNHLNHYIELEKLRYGDDLQFEYDIQEKEFTLPALTVQPLVENAVNHGIRYHKMKGKVKISSNSDDKNYYVIIEDNGVGFDPDKYMSDGKKHVGIANVKYRLEVLCGGSVEIKSKKDKGTVVTIRIPKEK